MPSAIPPSSLGIPTASDDPATQPRPKYVVSGSGGHAAHPDDIVQSCRALQAHVSKLVEDAQRELRAFEEGIRERELAEKRRVAPGWLDSEAKILEPERAGAAAAEQGQGLMDRESEEQIAAAARAEKQKADEAAEMDRAFGGMALQ